MKVAAARQGIDFFKRGYSGEPADDLSRGRRSGQFRLSSTTLTYGDQMPALPVLSYDNVPSAAGKLHRHLDHLQGDQGPGTERRSLHRRIA